MSNEKILVISAHAADYVWRSGGTLANYASSGVPVKVVVLSFGVRGESNGLWKTENQTYENVKEIRYQETKRAASYLGLTDLEYWDLPDYPLPIDSELDERVVKLIRQYRPTIIITHDKFDVLNPDHNNVHEMVWRCSVMANSAGIRIDGLPETKQMKIFGFEPHQTEISHYMPTEIIDITNSYDKKIAAMQCFKGQSHLIEYYTQRAFMRGNHARRIFGNSNYKYAETFSSMYPIVSEKLV